MKFTFSLLRILALVFALLAIVGASNPIEARGIRQGETLRQTSSPFN